MSKRKKKDKDKTKKVKKIKDEAVAIQPTVTCEWVSNDPLYIAYHDNEWGKPVYNSIALFEMLCLEGQQAGLSWITVLKKREHYKSLFCNFNPHKISKFDDKDIEKFLSDPGVIRHRAKLEAIIQNAKCYLKMKEESINFSNFIWSFVGSTPIINKWSNAKEVPTQTEESRALSNALKKRGFKFVGATICYAFMQACGLVNDHTSSCICHVTD